MSSSVRPMALNRATTASCFSSDSLRAAPMRAGDRVPHACHEAAIKCPHMHTHAHMHARTHAPRMHAADSGAHLLSARA